MFRKWERGKNISDVIGSGIHKSMAQEIPANISAWLWKFMKMTFLASHFCHHSPLICRLSVCLSVYLSGCQLVAGRYTFIQNSFFQGRDCIKCCAQKLHNSKNHQDHYQHQFPNHGSVSSYYNLCLPLKSPLKPNQKISVIFKMFTGFPWGNWRDRHPI